MVFHAVVNVHYNDTDSYTNLQKANPKVRKQNEAKHITDVYEIVLVGLEPPPAADKPDTFQKRL